MGGPGEDFKGGKFSAETRHFNPLRSKSQEALREVVGPVARHFTLEAHSDKKKAKGEIRPICLTAPAACIRLKGLEGWWRQLKTVLDPRTPE